MSAIEGQVFGPQARVKVPFGTDKEDEVVFPFTLEHPKYPTL